jgi:hypothetical protein
MSTTTATQPRAGRTRVGALGLTMVVAGIVGAASAVVVILWPDQVSDRHYSYPFSVTWYAVAQVFFAVQHLGLIAGLVGLTGFAWPRASRPTRVGLVLTTAGLVGLTACELFAITAADALVDTARANAVDNSYGIPMTAMGIGMVLAGTGLARRPVLTGAGRWWLLALGVYLFVVMFPAVFGPMVAGRIAIGIWMLIFAALGAALIRAEREGARS